MEDAFDSGHGAFDVIDVAHVPFEELDIFRHPVRLPLEVRGRLEVVEDAHVVPLLEKEVDDVGADQTRPACDERLHREPVTSARTVAVYSTCSRGISG